MFHFLTTSNLLLGGVFAQLLATLARAVWKRPKQQAQINAIETKVDSVLGTVQQVLPVVQTLNRNSFSTPGQALATVENLTMALNPLPAGQTASTSAQTGLNSAGGA